MIFNVFNDVCVAINYSSFCTFVSTNCEYKSLISFTFEFIMKIYRAGRRCFSHRNIEYISTTFCSLTFASQCHYWLPAIHIGLRPIYTVTNSYLCYTVSLITALHFKLSTAYMAHSQNESNARYLRRSYVCGPTLASPGQLWGTCPAPRLPFFSGHFRAAQTLTLDSMWLSAHK